MKTLAQFTEAALALGKSFYGHYDNSDRVRAIVSAKFDVGGETFESFARIYKERGLTVAGVGFSRQDDNGNDRPDGVDALGDFGSKASGVLSYATSAIHQLVQKHPEIDVIIFSGEGNSRVKLYDRYVPALVKKLGFAAMKTSPVMRWASHKRSYYIAVKDSSVLDHIL